MKVPGVLLLRPVEANAVFVSLAPAIEQSLRQRGWSFYGFIGDGLRVMCSWDTRTEDVDAFISDAQAAAAVD